VHISEGVLSAPVLLAGWAVTAPAVAAILWRVRQSEIPRIACFSALFFVAASGQNHFSFSWFGLLIALCGPATVVPLLLFNSAATRLNLSTIGYLQYISPSMQLLLAVFYYGEQVSALKALSFLLIWSALAVVSFSAIYSKKSKISV